MPASAASASYNFLEYAIKGLLPPELVDSNWRVKGHDWFGSQICLYGSIKYWPDNTPVEAKASMVASLQFQCHKLVLQGGRPGPLGGFVASLGHYINKSGEEIPFVVYGDTQPSDASDPAVIELENIRIDHPFAKINNIDWVWSIISPDAVQLATINKGITILEAAGPLTSNGEVEEVRVTSYWKSRISAAVWEHTHTSQSGTASTEIHLIQQSP